MLSIPSSCLPPEATPGTALGSTVRHVPHHACNLTQDGISCVHKRQFSSITQSCLTLCNPMDCSTPGFPVHHQLPELAQTRVHRRLSDAIHPSHPLSPPLLLPSIFPRIRGFSNELVLPIRWPKHQVFSFSISPSNEY